MPDLVWLLSQSTPDMLVPESTSTTELVSTPVPLELASDEEWTRTEKEFLRAEREHLRTITGGGPSLPAGGLMGDIKAASGSDRNTITRQHAHDQLVHADGTTIVVEEEAVPSVGSGSPSNSGLHASDQRI